MDNTKVSSLLIRNIGSAIIVVSAVNHTKEIHMKKHTSIALLLFGAMPFAYAGLSSPPGTAPSVAASVVASSATPDAQKSLGACTEAYAPALTALKTSAIDVSDPKKAVAKGDIAAKKLTGSVSGGAGSADAPTASTGVLTATAAPPLGFAREDLAAHNCIQTGTA